LQQVFGLRSMRCKRRQMLFVYAELPQNIGKMTFGNCKMTRDIGSMSRVIRQMSCGTGRMTHDILA
jgi:hypothetical protein